MIDDNFEADAISDLVKKKVNRHGELHLDKELTETLLRWLMSVERTLERQDKFVKELQKLMGLIK